MTFRLSETENEQLFRSYDIIILTYYDVNVEVFLVCQEDIVGRTYCSNSDSLCLLLKRGNVQQQQKTNQKIENIYACGLLGLIFCEGAAPAGLNSLARKELKKAFSAGLPKFTHTVLLVRVFHRRNTVHADF